MEYDTAGTARHVVSDAIASTITSSMQEKPPAFVVRRLATGRRIIGGLAVGALRGRHDDEALELEKVLLADAFHVHQLLDLLEPAALLTVFQDPGGHCRTNPRQLLQ